jgi:hypothetical protein
MFRHWFTIVALVFWHTAPLVLAADDVEVLIPISDDDWDAASPMKVRRENSDLARVELQQTEHFVWGPAKGM